MIEMNSKFDCVSTILSNKTIAKDHLKLTLSCSPIAHRVRPGQFVMVKIDNRFDPLLRRPFSVYRTKSNQLEIVYQIVGRGTEILSTKSPGEKLQIFGPIGNGFTIPATIESHSSKASQHSKQRFNLCSQEREINAILVGGGVGIASLMLLAVELRKREIDVIALVGAITQDRLIGIDDLAEIRAKVRVSTDDGSAGYHGLVTELLENTIEKNHPRIIYACGPQEMLKSIAKIASAKDIPAQLSTESHMACGLGACLGCVIKVKASDGGLEYSRVCQDGPVFNAQEVVFSD